MNNLHFQVDCSVAKVAQGFGLQQLLRVPWTLGPGLSHGGEGKHKVYRNMATRISAKSKGEDENAKPKQTAFWFFAFRPCLGFFELFRFFLLSQTLA